MLCTGVAASKLHRRTLPHTAAHCGTNKEKLLQHEDPSSDQNCITKSFTELTHCNDAPCTLCNDALQHELQLSTSDATHCNEAPQHTALHADQRCVEEKCGSAKVANSDAVSIAKLQNCKTASYCILRNCKTPLLMHLNWAPVQMHCMQ